MILNKYTAKETARLLLQIKAVKLSPKTPFIWTSGWKSPVYCDNRIILSYPSVRNFLKERITKLIEEKYEKPDVIAGVATGAIAIGVLVAQELELPFVYVRSEPKEHGRKNQIEGFLESGQNVIVIEDLISTGKSSLNAIKALKKAEVAVKGMIAVFSYGFSVAEETFNKHDVDFSTLCDYSNLLEQALNSNYITQRELKTLQSWRLNPGKWGE